MKLLIFGSSLCRYLRDFDKAKNRIIAGVNVRFIYRHFSGLSFHDFIDNTPLIDDVLACKPDLVLVIFGANSIVRARPKRIILENCRDFYQILYDKLQVVNPRAKIIAHQAPLRFLYKFEHDTPLPEDFRKIRKALNERIRLLPTKHFMLNISGVNKLDDERLFKDGIHFKRRGLEIQFNLILEKLDHVVEHYFA